MTSQTYRSLDARGDSLTIEDVRDAGGVDDRDLADRFVADGGPPPPTGATCLHAMTTHRESARGLALFCFGADGSVDVRRQRSDVTP